MSHPTRRQLLASAAQDAHYPAVTRRLVALKYAGQEFIPTRDPLAGLTQVVRVCDV